MTSRENLGDFEHLVMLAVMRLGEQAYGVTVRQEIASRTHRDVSIGAVYATLDRLQRKGYVKSQMGDATPQRGGKRKRFFRITAAGATAVNRTHRALRSMAKGLHVAEKFS
jgi:PadR family transcriptional regulator